MQANCIWGYINPASGLKIPIYTISRAEATKRKINKNETIAVKKGEEFYISYGSGFWRKIKNLHPQKMEEKNESNKVKWCEKRKRQSIL